MAPLLSILFWAFLHSCLRFLVSQVLLLALPCISVVLHRITQVLTLSQEGEIFLGPGSIFHLQVISGQDIFFDSSKLNNGSLETSGFLKAQQNDLSGNLFPYSMS